MCRGRRQVARTVAHSSAVRPRAWPRRVGGSAAAVHRNPSIACRVERSDRHGLAGVTGGARDGRDGHRGGRRRPARLVEVPEVGGEARVVERPVGEPGADLAEGRVVGAAGVGRRREAYLDADGVKAPLFQSVDRAVRLSGRPLARRALSWP